MRALCTGLVLFLAGCTSAPQPGEWETVLVRAPTLYAYTQDGVLAGEVALAIDPPAVLARIGDVITWTVTLANGLVGEDLIVRAGVSYTAPDGTRQSLTTQALLSLDVALLDVDLVLYVPFGTGYIWGSLTAQMVPADGSLPIVLAPSEVPIADPVTGEPTFHVRHGSIGPGATLQATYATEVGGVTTMPDGSPWLPPPPPPL